jgi:hypothetical protein
LAVENGDPTGGTETTSSSGPTYGHGTNQGHEKTKRKTYLEAAVSTAGMNVKNETGDKKETVSFLC